MSDGQRVQASDEDLAFRLGRHADALVAGDSGRVDPPEIADLAKIARALASAPRAGAPESVHAHARERLARHSRWVELVTTAPHDETVAAAATNGHAVQASAVPTAMPEPPRALWRRILPVVELAALAAVVLLLTYVYVTSDHDRAAQPTVVPTPVPSPTIAAPAPTVVGQVIGDWPMLGGDPARGGAADRALPATAPALRWTAALPAGIRYPVAAGDAVYASNGGTIVALDAGTGGERWRFDLGVAPSVAGASPPAVVGGTVYVAAKDGTVVALDAATGSVAWTHEVGGTVVTAVAVANGAVVVGTTDGVVYALDAASGEQRWASPVGSVSLSSPVVADDLVYVGAGGNDLVALDAATGTVRWKKAVKAGMQSVAVGDGLLVAAGVNTSNAVLLVAVEAGSGDARWQSGTVAELPPAIAKGTVYVAGNSGVTALDATHGTRRWHVETMLKVVDVAVVGDAVLACRADGTLIALDAATGKERWRVVTGGAATGVTVGFRVVYVVQRDGTMAAFG